MVVTVGSPNLTLSGHWNPTFFQLSKLTKCPLRNPCKCHPKAEGLKNQKSEKGHFPPSVDITVGPHDSSRKVHAFDNEVIFSHGGGNGKGVRTIRDVLKPV